MQASRVSVSNNYKPGESGIARKLSYFFVAPTTVAVIISLSLALLLGLYQQRHADKIFTGVSAWGVDLSEMNKAQARRELGQALPYLTDGQILLIDTGENNQWVYTPSELGLSLDLETTVEEAFSVGRQGGPLQRLREQYDSWFYGRQVAPVLVLDEGQIATVIWDIATKIARPATDASLTFNGTDVSYSEAEVGRILDTADAKERLTATLHALNQGRIELLIHETPPRIDDASEAAKEIRQIMSGPISIYLQEPLEGVDLERATIPVKDLASWIRVRTMNNAQGELTTEVFFDENAIRAWLLPYQDSLARDPVKAQFYFDDDLEELVLVEPHTNGRTLDIDATIALFQETVKTPNRSMPFVLKDIVPTVHSGATAEELGITELVSESTTWFYGSSAERMHNIARSASNFYGIVIAPGEEFSFNQFLGEVSAEQGYETGLIIFGGRTIEGIGGGVCQVSTTVFQAAFWAGYPVVERWEHGYQVRYYDDGEGPGMDATVYSPLVDFRFINDTPHHLLIENYYSEVNSSLTFKFYSTSMGREVVKEGPEISNVVPPKPDIWELNEELETGEIEQVDWAVEGADVTVGRIVYNANGELLRQDTFVSNYVPWQNIYQYGPGTELPEEDIPADEEPIDEGSG